MDNLPEILTGALLVAMAVSLVILTFRLARRDKKTIRRVGTDTAAGWAGDSLTPGYEGSSHQFSDSGGSDGGGDGD
ncbi:MAG: hypothetical protein ABMA01_11650 [Chthoniobacteraceae bacterium]